VEGRIEKIVGKKTHQFRVGDFAVMFFFVCGRWAPGRTVRVLFVRDWSRRLKDS
jgi:hypothetical protein